jgi:hypothetical protein
MKKFLFIAILSSVSFLSQAQKYFTKDGSIKFFSDAKMEKIQATNNKATCVVDAATGDIQWSVLIKGFVFENAFMGEHFNETYMESDKFDKATFKGKVENISAINFKADGTYKAKVSGELTMHGVTKPVELKARHNATIQTKQGIDVAGFKVTGTIKRTDFGVGKDFPTAVASDEMQLNADIEISRK